MKKFSFRSLAAVLAAALTLTVCAVVFGAAAETPVGADGATAAPTEIATADGASQYTPISSSPTTSPDGGDYYSAAADMNHDMVINSADARFILRLAARIEWVKQPRYLPAGMIFGDMDENGKVNAADARWTLRVAAKLNTVPEVIEQTLAKPVPSTTQAPTTAAPSTAPTTVTTTAAPTTTSNPLELEMPICDEFAVKMKTTENVSYVVASDGTACYVRSDDLLKGFSVLVDRVGTIYVINDANKEYCKFGAPFASKILGISAEKVRAYVEKVAVPEFGVFENCKKSTEIIKDIPMTVAERDGVKFYFYADGQLTKIVGKTLKDAATDYTVSEYTDDASAYTSLPENYAAKSSNEFILKYGIDFLTSKF